MLRTVTVALLLATATACGPAMIAKTAAEPPLSDRGAGRKLAQDRCGTCHAVSKDMAASPHGKAPPFAEVARLYPPEQLAEALSEGIMVGHEDMPEFEFTDDEVSQLIAYLNSLK